MASGVTLGVYSACLNRSHLISSLNPSFLLRVSRPADQDAFFIDIMVKAPVIQIFSLLLGLVIVAFEYPAPFVKGTAAYRSLVLRVVLLVFQVFFAILFYQVRFPCTITIVA